MTARPIRYQRQVSDRNGKNFLHFYHFFITHKHKGMACFIIAVTIFCFLSGQNNNAALHIISELPACAARKVKQRAASPSLPQ